MERILQSWSGLSSHFVGECFDYAAPFIDNGYTGLDRLVRFVSAQLYIDCHLSSESVLLLIRYQKEWDADLIARSVMEGSIKLTYMLQGSGEDVIRKADEYWNVLPKFTAVKHSERVQRLLSDLPDAEHSSWRPLRDLLLDDLEIAGIRAEYSRQERRKLEEDWSFAGICRKFANSDQPGLKELTHLAHGYGMSSHLLHKDADGVGIVWERYGRDPARRDAVRLGHSARIVSDVCSFAQLRLCSLLKACGEPTAPTEEIRRRYQVTLFDQIAQAGAQFTEVEYGLGG